MTTVLVTVMRMLVVSDQVDDLVESEQELHVDGSTGVEDGPNGGLAVGQQPLKQTLLIGNTIFPHRLVVVFLCHNTHIFDGE